MTTPSNTPPKGSKNLKHCQMMANTTEHLKFIPTKVEKQKHWAKTSREGIIFDFQH